MILAWPLAKWIRSIWRIASEIHRERVRTRDRLAIARAVTNGRSARPALKEAYKRALMYNIRTGIFGHVGGTRRDLFRTGPCEQRLCALGDTVAEFILVSLVCWIDMQYASWVARGYLAPQTVPDKLLDDTNVSKRWNKNTGTITDRSTSGRTELEAQWTLYLYFIADVFYSPVKQNYRVLNHLGAWTAFEYPKCDVFNLASSFKQRKLCLTSLSLV
jgi:hypothetical protein